MRASLALLLLPALALAQLKRTDEVDTSWGKVRGLVVQPPVPSLEPVDVFLGIPYAEKPLGPNRFMMPRTPARWTGRTKDAVEAGSECVQTGVPDVSRRSEALGDMPPLRYDFIRRLMPSIKAQSEDCLYLNLYVPQRQGPVPRAELGVLVLVGGESYEWGGGSGPYNASILASYSQLIVVTLSYRQGVLGFLSSGDSAARGNWGLSDVVCALSFLRDILRPFGGNPDAITLAGWGSGAAIVNLLMASPMSAPAGSRLFKRAVLLGGSSLGPEAIVRNPAENFYRLASALDCPTTVGTKNAQEPKKLRPVTEILACVKGHSLQNLTRASEGLERASFLSTFGPVIDGTIVHTDPSFNLKHHSALYHDVDLMIGLTSSPAYQRLSAQDIQQGIDVSRQDKIYRTLSRNLYQFHRREIFEAIKNHYTDWSSPGMHPISVRDGVLEALSDCLVIAPSVRAAQLHANQGSTSKSTTFLYVFSYGTSEWDRGSVRGAVGGEDLPYLLGYPLLHPTSMADLPYQASYSRPERLISEAMMRYLSNFVKSGDPNQPIPIRSPNAKNKRFEDLKWPPFEYQKEAYVIIDEYFGTDERPRGDGVYYRADDVALWNKFLPSLQDAGKDADSGAIEAHNLLPDHFQKSSYFGIVRPYGGYSDLPFPPPPLPPTPLPKELTTMLQDQKKKGDEVTPAVAPAGAMEYSTILSVTVAVGCALLVLNILIFAGIYHQRDKQKRSKKQLQLHYQSYDTTTGGLNLNSPVSAGGVRMPPPPPPPITAAISSSPAPNSGRDTDSESFHAAALHGGGTPGGTSMRTFHHHHHLQQHNNNPVGNPTGSNLRLTGSTFQEQEPLLSSGMGRGHGISPTCPRHGRALAAAHANAQQPGTLEEIQV